MIRRMFWIWTTLAAAVGPLCIAPEGLEAQRGGFIIGFGLGAGLTSLRPESHGVQGDRQTAAAVFTDLKIGYAPSEQVAVYYANQASFFKLDDARDDVTLHATGLTGIGVTYFLGPESPYALDGSVGLASFGILFDDGTTDLHTGPGLSLGGSVALSDVWFLDIDLLFGRPADDSIDYRTLALRAAIAVLSH